jgi:nucleoside-diphosphate kinase
MQSFHLDRATAEEFFELYKGVLPDYIPMIDQIISGPCIALEVRQENVVPSFKKLVGAYDPTVGASKGEKDTIRQLYSYDR